MTTTQTRKYRIPPGKSICVGQEGEGPTANYRLLTGPRIVSSDQVPDHKIEGFVKNGFLIPMTDAKPDLSGIQAQILGNDSVRSFDSALPLTRPEEVDDGKGKMCKPAKPESKSSIWDSNPEKLLGKNVKELNAMISERDPGIPAFETSEEAAAWLSQDYGG